jgi:hypothetical protein
MAPDTAAGATPCNAVMPGIHTKPAVWVLIKFGIQYIIEYLGEYFNKPLIKEKVKR